LEPKVVIDNSIVMSWCFEDEANQYADQVLASLEYIGSLVPFIWSLEVGNVLSVAERKGRLKRADSFRFLNLLSELPITIEQENPERLMREIYILATEAQLSTYDASYLHLAMRKGLALATLDKALIKAASNMSIPLFEKI